MLGATAGVIFQGNAEGVSLESIAPQAAQDRAVDDWRMGPSKPRQIRIQRGCRNADADRAGQLVEVTGRGAPAGCCDTAVEITNGCAPSERRRALRVGRGLNIELIAAIGQSFRVSITRYADDTGFRRICREEHAPRGPRRDHREIRYPHRRGDPRIAVRRVSNSQNIDWAICRCHGQ